MENIIFFIVIVSVLNGVNTLQCYQCTNCPTVKSDQIVTCGASTNVTTTTPSTTTHNSNSTNTTTTTPTTTQNSTSTNTTTTPSTTTQNSTSTNATTTTTTTPSTPTQNTTAESSNSTTNSTSQNNIAPEILRVKRNVEDACLCEDGICDCNGLRIIKFSELRASDVYVCVTDKVDVNGTTVVKRGCAVKNNATVQTCINSAFSTNCTVCETDKCNDANSISFSVFVILTSLTFAFKFH